MKNIKNSLPYFIGKLSPASDHCNQLPLCVIVAHLLQVPQIGGQRYDLFVRNLHTLDN